MGIARKIKVFILCACVLIFFLLIGYGFQLLTTAWISVIAIFAVLLLLWLYFSTARPLAKFEESLEHRIERESSSEKLLEGISDDIIFKNKIKDLIEKCANQMIRENSAEMLDKQAELAAL